MLSVPAQSRCRDAPPIADCTPGYSLPVGIERSTLGGIPAMSGLPPEGPAAWMPAERG